MSALLLLGLRGMVVRNDGDADKKDSEMQTSGGEVVAWGHVRGSRGHGCTAASWCVCGVASLTTGVLDMI